MRRCFLTSLLFCSLSSFLSAQVISIDFAGDNGGGGANFVISTDIAGVVPVANWNGDSSQLATGSISSLVDDSGAATTAAVSWSGSANTWGGLEGIPGTTTGDEWMMNGWLDDNGTGADVQITGIPYDFYDVYVYGSSDGTGNLGRGWTTQVNGVDYFSGGEFTNESLDGSYFSSSVGFVDASTTAPDPSYFKINSLSGSTLSVFGQSKDGPILPGGDDFYRGSISGIQIVELDTPLPNVEINRETGSISLVNQGAAPYSLTGYSLLSNAGALDDGGWTSITGNYDSAGDGSVSSDAWNILTASNIELAESTLGTGSIAASGTVDLGIAWRKYPGEDVSFELLDADGNVIAASVTFVGNGGEAFGNGDFNFDGTVDVLDWPIVRDNFNSDFSDVTAVDAYYMGECSHREHHYGLDRINSSEFRKIYLKF